MTEKEDKSKFVNSAINWLYKMECLEDPVIQSHLYHNIYSQSKRIIDCEILIDKKTKAMLIYIKLSFLGKLFKRTKKIIIENILENLKYILPKYSVRVITNKTILDLALTKQTKELEKKDEKSDKLPNDDNVNSISNDDISESSESK